MISETTYYMRGHDWEMVYVETMYDKERVSGTLFDNIQSITWTVKLGCWFKQMQKNWILMMMKFVQQTIEWSP